VRLFASAAAALAELYPLLRDPLQVGVTVRARVRVSP
jgi:hypothetical protein